MGLPTEGGGTDVATQVDFLSDEIESLIGQLRGVEDSWRQLTAPLQGWEDAQAQSPALPGATLVGRNFHIRGDYGFEVGYQFPSNDLQADNDDDAAQIQAAMDSAFEAARGSGAGALEFSRYVLTQVIEPDHAAIAAAASAMEEVALSLFDYTDYTAPQFVERLKKTWPATSRGSESFYEFYRDLGDKCTHYHGGLAQLAAVTAATSSIIRNYQDNLVDVLRSARDQLVRALESWQSFKGPDQLVTIERSGDDNAASLFGASSLVLGIVGLATGGVAVGGASVVAGILSYTQDDKDVDTFIDTVSTVLDITTHLTEGLLALRREMGDAFDTLQHKKTGWPPFGAFVEHSLNNDLWKARTVDLG